MSKHLIVHANPLPASNEKIKLVKGQPKLCDAVKKALVDGAWEKVLPFIQAVDKVDSVSGSLPFDKAFAAQAMKAHLIDSGDTGDSYPVFNEVAISRAMTWALKAMRDENGNALDHKSRRDLAIADMSKRQDIDNA